MLKLLLLFLFLVKIVFMEIIDKFPNIFLMPKKFSDTALDIIKSAVSHMHPSKDLSMKLSRCVILHFENIQSNKGVMLSSEYDASSNRRIFKITEIVMKGSVKQKYFRLLDITSITVEYDVKPEFKTYSSYDEEHFVDELRILLYRSDIIDHILS